MADERIEELKGLLPRAMLHDWVRLGSRLVRLLRDRHHPARHEELLNRLLAQARASVALREQRRQALPLVAYPPHLPISARKEEIVSTIRAHQVVVVAGETGSGKTTQLPKMCLEAGLGIEARIGCTQPRRVAALSISRRIAEELNVEWGREVGCQIRFEDRSSPETYIKLMTDGILLAETQGDPLLSEYNALILDEAHERSLNIDFLLGYLKGLLAKRPELKLLITSATIDTAAFSAAFGHAPIIEVSGRVYPVEVRYAPLDNASEETGDITYIDAAVRAAQQVLSEPGGGDVLVFMPTERDIRETSDLLRDTLGEGMEIIPLFGRLSSGEQQRVFATCSRRKVVVATNIAETSLTIPGIRYVIDSGLARLSRYNPRTRTRRLPIEPISQSSANQRKGRSGRVRHGVCIRLYAEQDLAERPAYTQPEIQRANLAEVILRMKAFRLGEIETFPFLNPPTPAAIQGGYKLLQELGALDEQRQLTALGQDLARLPIDPTLGRMLLQAQREHATGELLIIAAGLSIQDPRERPLAQRDAAHAAHERFADPKSDFLTLLNLWNAVHSEWESLRTQNQRRKFCRAHFLSYLRMREWQDLHAQLHDALAELGRLSVNRSNAAYEAIHRSILSGLLGHLAHRVERNLYQACGNRQVRVFPGSVLYERGDKPAKGADKKQKKAAPSAQPEWLVAGELVETSNLFARTVAGVEPEWVAELGAHLCKRAHRNPHWDPEPGRVLAEETMTLYGLDLCRRTVAYGNINPKEATEIFIRSALVEQGLGDGNNRRWAFLEHNRKLRQKLETWQTRSRRHDLGDLDQALFDFYARQLQNVSSRDELARRLREHPEPGFLCASEAELAPGQDLTFNAQAFPDAVTLANHVVPLSYAYCPGEEQDGVTLELDFHLAQSVPGASVEWSVPGLREGQIAELLRALPKALRRQLMPLPPKVAEIARELHPSGESLQADLAQFLRRRYGLAVPPDAWPVNAVPAHLRPRVTVLGKDRQVVAATRDVGRLRVKLETAKVEPPSEPLAWKRLAAKWERFGLAGWTFGDLPEYVQESGPTGTTQAWPGLELQEEHVNLRLFHTREAAQQASLAGVRRLVELALQKDLAWLEKDLRALWRLEPLIVGFSTVEELQAEAFEHLKRWLLPEESFPALVEASFRAAVTEAKRLLPGLAPQFIERLENILQLRHELLVRYGSRPAAPAPARRSLNRLDQLTNSKPATARLNPAVAELNELLPRHFLQSTSSSRLAHYPRYLKALLVRAERAKLNPLKDQERARQVRHYAEQLGKLQAGITSPTARRSLERFRWLLEEFKVSLFAQELGTAVPVSPKRLDEHLQTLLTLR